MDAKWKICAFFEFLHDKMRYSYLLQNRFNLCLLSLIFLWKNIQLNLKRAVEKKRLKMFSVKISLELNTSNYLGFVNFNQQALFFCCCFVLVYIIVLFVSFSIMKWESNFNKRHTHFSFFFFSFWKWSFGRTFAVCLVNISTYHSLIALGPIELLLLFRLFCLFHLRRIKCMEQPERRNLFCSVCLTSRSSIDFKNIFPTLFQPN